MFTSITSAIPLSLPGEHIVSGELTIDLDGEIKIMANNSKVAKELLLRLGSNNLLGVQVSFELANPGPHKI